MKKFIALMCLCISTSAVAEWTLAFESDNMTGYVSLDSVQKSQYRGKPIVGAWTRMEFSPELSENVIDSTMIFVWYMCKNRESSNPTHIDTYNGGLLFSSSKDSIREFDPVVPETLVAAALDVACTQALIYDWTYLDDDADEKEMRDVLDRYHPRHADYLGEWLEYTYGAEH